MQAGFLLSINQMQVFVLYFYRQMILSSVLGVIPFRPLTHLYGDILIQSSDYLTIWADMMINLQKIYKLCQIFT